MKKFIVLSNIIIGLSYISLYIYILIFYFKFGKIATLDPKELKADFFYEIILFLQLFAVFFFLIIFIIMIVNFVITRKMTFKKLLLFSILNSFLFFVLYFFDFGNLQSWFFD